MGEETTARLSPEDWLSEASLWCLWLHVGRGEAAMRCEVLVMKAGGITDALEMCPLMKHIVWEYAKTFHARLVSVTHLMVDWPNDLRVPFASYDELVASMPSKMREFIGSFAVNHLSDPNLSFWFRSLFRRSVQDVGQLEEKVQRGLCTLVMGDDGEIHEVVTRVTLRMEDDAGQLFVQLGTCWDKGGTIEPLCQLPDTLLLESELPENGLHRLLTGKLAPFSDSITVRKVVKETEWTDSAWRCIRTANISAVYLSKFRTLHHNPGVPIMSLSLGSEAGPLSRKWRNCVLLMDGNNSTVMLCTWLSKQDFDFYKSPAGRPALARQLTGKAISAETAHQCRVVWEAHSSFAL